MITTALCETSKGFFLQHPRDSEHKGEQVYIIT